MSQDVRSSLHRLGHSRHILRTLVAKSVTIAGNCLLTQERFIVKQSVDEKQRIYPPGKNNGISRFGRWPKRTPVYVQVTKPASSCGNYDGDQRRKYVKLQERVRRNRGRVHWSTKHQASIQETGVHSSSKREKSINLNLIQDLNTMFKIIKNTDGNHSAASRDQNGFRPPSGRSHRSRIIFSMSLRFDDTSIIHRQCHLSSPSYILYLSNGTWTTPSRLLSCRQQLVLCAAEIKPLFCNGIMKIFQSSTNCLWKSQLHCTK